MKRFTKAWNSYRKNTYFLQTNHLQRYIEVHWLSQTSAPESLRVDERPNDFYLEEAPLQLGERGFCMNASPVKRDQLLTRSTIYSGSLRQLQNIKNEKLDNKRR